MCRLPRFAFLALTLLTPLLAFPATARTEGGKVFVNEVPVFSLKASVAGIDATRRAQAVANRIQNQEEPFTLTIKKVSRGHLIKAGDATLLQVDAADAASYKSTTASLALSWSAAIANAVAMAPLTLAKTEIALPAGSMLVVPMRGRDAATSTIGNPDETLVSAQRVTGGVQVRALALGTVDLSVIGTNESATLRVRVLPMAATLPTTVEAEVVGLPTNAETVASVIRGAIVTHTQRQPGATVTVDPINVDALAPGDSRSVTVRTVVNAPDAIPVEGSVTVVVRNPGVAKTPEAELWYCNDPETIRRPQELFRATLENEVPVRMLYHHIDESGGPLIFRVDVFNPSDLPARLMITPGDCKPDKNPVLAGLQAGEVFLRNYLTGSGEIVTIPPHSSMPLSFRPLTISQTASGLCYLRLLGGGPSMLRVIAAADDMVPLDDRWTAAGQSPTPWREVGMQPIGGELGAGEDAQLIFPRPFREEAATYKVGGAFQFIRVGQKAIVRKTEGKPLDGNFGVIYQVLATATNPTNVAANVEVVFEASAGYSGALFVVDGVFRRVQPLQPKGEVQLARFRLEPNSTQQVSIMTIPLSGSSYPATIVIRPVNTLPPVGKL